MMQVLRQCLQFLEEQREISILYTTIDEYHYRVSDKELEDSLLFDLNARRIIIIICYNYIMIMLQYLNMKLLFLFFFPDSVLCITITPQQ